MGLLADCEFCVRGIDARGMELFTRIPVAISGIKKNCRKCDPNRPAVVEEFLEAASWRLSIATMGASQRPEEAR